MLSEKTLAEMTAGAQQVRVNEGKLGELPPGYLEACINTQTRMAQLKAWEKAGKVTIEYATRYRTNVEEPVRATLIKVGDHTFQDLHAQETGAWPSEVLIAQVALCLMANAGKEWKDDT